MTEPLDVLVIEDDESDYHLISRELARGDRPVRCVRVDSRAALIDALEHGHWDAVLSDYYLPGLAFADCLSFVRGRLPEVPLILVSGGIGEEAAVEWLKRGVSDYVLKDRLSRLGDVLARCLREVDTRRSRQIAEAALRESEARFRATFEQVAVGIAHLATDGSLLWANERLCSLLGHFFDEIRDTDGRKLIDPEDQGLGRRLYRRLIVGQIDHFSQELRCLHANGTPIWCNVTLSVARHDDARPDYLIAVVEDIRRRKHIEQQLGEALAEAHRADAAKTRFLAAASHDLRQPAQSLVMFVALLKNKLSGGPLATAITQMESAVGALTGMLAGMLDLSRLDAGVVEPRLATVNVADMLRNLASEYALCAEAVGLRLRLATGRKRSVLTDSTLLERILRNLLENALRYTKSGGIVIGCRRHGALLRIEIVDSGIGIESLHLDAIFEELFQVGNIARDRSQGLGLGLAIVRRIARLIGAQIEVRSRPGKGSRFSVILPLAENRDVKSGLTGANLGSGLTLLVIDDDPCVRKGIEMALECYGYAVLAAEDETRAIELLDRQGSPPHLIIADYRLGPGRTGVEVAQSICDRWATPVPAVILTGDTRPERIQQVLATGFAILHKPAGVDALLAAIQSLIARPDAEIV